MSQASTTRLLYPAMMSLLRLLQAAAANRPEAMAPPDVVRIAVVHIWADLLDDRVRLEPRDGVRSQTNT
jgi:hypothetical protein